MPATGEEAAPAKTKRTRRTAKPAADGEEVTKPKRRTTRTTRVKRTVATDSSAPISDEVAQARALAQISEAQVVRARRRAAEREAAALTELAAPSVPETPAATETPASDQPTEKPAPRTRRRTAAKVEQVAEQVTPELTEASVRSAAGEGTSPAEPAAPVEAGEVPVVDPALRPHRRGRKPKAFVEAEKAAAAAAAAARDAAATAESATAADAPVQDATTSEAAPADAEPADVRPGRSRRTAAKRTSKAKAAKKGASEDSAETTADASTDVAEPQDVEQPASEKPKRGRKKSARAKAAEQQADVEAQVDTGAEANDAAAANVDTAATDGAAPAEGEDGARPNRRQHKRNDERNERKDDRNNDRRNRQRDRKQRNKERNAAPTEPTLSREELAAMKVAELREKAKEFEIETTGKKKAELVEEIYTTAAKAEGFRDIKGILQIRPDSSGIIHAHGYMKSNDDAFVPAYLIRSARLRTGDVIEGSLRPSRGGDKRAGLAKITTVNGLDPEQIRNRPKFGDLTPVYPNEPLRMEHGKDSITGRAIDIVSPIGKGQRGLIVSPPKAGKTTILKKICQSISINNPEVHLICLLVDERPEEVTDMQRSIKGEVVASTFDMPADNHTRVAELVIERAKRIVELGGDVVVVLDSITRLARAYNLAAPASGRILSGGVDSAALYPPKRFLGAARNIENGGSLTILASALIDTGSKMDEVIFEEFKGTGNMELKLDRDLADRRIFPAIDPVASGTRNEDLLVDEQMRPFVFGLRRILAGMNNTERAAASFIKGLKGTNTNQEFLVRSAKKHSDYEQTF
ncbi:MULTISPECIES: transcription termination factor Rho [unclassified Collinsella]|uniref:transcription termination factor Rho n=1 Tax=unclassified Collinsella TaxID=2637548 RepID=UPI000E4F3F5D|nr:transcription termination factor Rho [Collinsella sp. AM10-48]RHJ38506.1 transcription termination factor Rho [Collinsella sp. AM10-32]RHJ42652.1 transcription termination factor Rho [Collinsella sp. AM10-27]RHJ44277.1 transcription termination factor Rho [Collinsella sp. AM10-26]RHJ51923.1 transcription termination factor Rho [Collinsella sp. AM10-11]